MNKKKIIFKADGNSTIGIGHVVRTLALASMLNDDYYCEFATRFESDFILSESDDIFTKVHLLSKKDDEHFDEFYNLLSGNEIVVLDNYFYSTEYQQKIKDVGCRLVCIDDIHDKHFVSDIVINHAPGISSENYSIEPYTKLLLGLKYSLLRPEFFNSGEVTRRKYSSFKRVLVSFGGTNNTTLFNKFIKLLDRVNVSTIDLLVTDTDIVSQLNISKNIKVNIHSSLNAKELIGVLKDVDLAIVPSSTLSYEIIAMNVPLITGYFVDNQTRIYEGLVAINSVRGVGDFFNVETSDFVKCFKSFESDINKFDGYNIITPQTVIEINNFFNDLLT